MSKTLVIGWREFRQHVRSRGFLLGTIITPVILLVVWFFTGLAGAEAEEPRAELTTIEPPEQVIGYVDQAALIDRIPDPAPAELFRSFRDVESARTALEAGEIGAYYLIPADYRQTGQIRRVSPELPTAPPDSDWINWILTANLMPEADSEELTRLRWPLDRSGPKTVILHADGEAQAQEGMQAMPFLLTIVLLIPLFTSGGYLLRSLTQEKSSRVMELLLVSVRPGQLLAGKLVGLGLLTLVQYLIWAAFGILVMGVGSSSAGLLLAGVNLSPGELGLMALYALGGFTLYAGLMAGIGALASDLQNSRTWVFVITLPMLIPMYLWLPIASAPNGLLAVVLSLFPFSAPVAMVMRLASTTVPAWQLGTSLVLLLAAGIGTIWLMARLFRAQALLSGESLSIRRFWSTLRYAAPQ